MINPPPTEITIITEKKDDYCDFEWHIDDYPVPNRNIDDVNVYSIRKEPALPPYNIMFPGVMPGYGDH
jgi:hypothetical protein